MEVGWGHLWWSNPPHGSPFRHRALGDPGSKEILVKGLGLITLSETSFGASLCQQRHGV